MVVYSAAHSAEYWVALMDVKLVVWLVESTAVHSVARLAEC